MKFANFARKAMVMGEGVRIATWEDMFVGVIVAEKLCGGYADQLGLCVCSKREVPLEGCPVPRLEDPISLFSIFQFFDVTTSQS